MGGGLEDGMIKYFSERVSIVNDMFERALADVQRYQQAAAQQAARIIAMAQQQRLINDARNQQLRLQAQERRRLQVLEYSLDYCTTPLSMTSSSDYVVVQELDNSIMLQTYLNIDKDSLPEENKKAYDKIRPMRTLLIEYLEPSSLRSVYNTTPGDLCVGSGETSYMDGLRRGSQRHYGIVVETSEGLHVAYHTHTERGKLTKEKFTSKYNRANYPFSRMVGVSPQNSPQTQEYSKKHRNDEILKQSVSIISKKK